MLFSQQVCALCKRCCLLLLHEVAAASSRQTRSGDDKPETTPLRLLWCASNEQTQPIMHTSDRCCYVDWCSRLVLALVNTILGTLLVQVLQVLRRCFIVFCLQVPLLNSSSTRHMILKNISSLALSPLLSSLGPPAPLAFESCSTLHPPPALPCVSSPCC